MASTFRTWAVSSLFLAFIPTAQAAIETVIEKVTVIDGVSRALVLEPNTRLQQAGDPATHYRGHLKEFPESWVRVSQIGGQWEGMLSHQGQLYSINGLQDASVGTQGRARTGTPPEAKALQNLESLGTCVEGFSPALPVSASKAGSKALAINNALANAATLNFPTACSDTIDGVCLVAELTVFFDDRFKNAFPTDYQSRGSEILNIVDGIYQNDLGIAFNILRLDFDNGEQFVKNDNPVDILTNMATLRAQDRVQPADPNIHSMMHLISGRNFVYDDGETVEPNIVGLARGTVYQSPQAFYSALCIDSGGTVGTSQVVGTGGEPNAALTAVIVAHELGHNLGMEHDGDVESMTASSCTDTDRIMFPSVVAGADQFSTCSHTAASLNISSLPAVEACFDFPAAASLTADAGNATRTGAATSEQHLFSVGMQAANGASGALAVTGTISSGDGIINSATLGAAPCTVSNSQRNYSCIANTPAALNALSVSFTTGNEDLTLQHAVSVGPDLFDLDASNNTHSATVQVQGPGLPPTSLTLSYSRSSGVVTLNWQDHANDETGYQVERKLGNGGWQVIADTLAADSEDYEDRTQGAGNRSYRVTAILPSGLSAPSNTASLETSSNRLQDHSTPGGGGGGSLGWLGLGGLLLLLTRRMYPRHPNKT